MRLRLIESGKLKAPVTAPPELLARLREHKAELVELLSGNCCRCCGETIGWLSALAITELGGKAMYLFCYKWSEVERIIRRAGSALSPEAMADEAEMMLKSMMV